MATTTGDISGNFRSRRPSIDRKLRQIQQELKNQTSHRKKSVNQTLNYAVILASKYLDHIDQEIEAMQIEKNNIENDMQKIENNLKEATEF